MSRLELSQKEIEQIENDINSRHRRLRDPFSTAASVEGRIITSIGRLGLKRTLEWASKEYPVYWPENWRRRRRELKAQYSEQKFRRVLNTRLIRWENKWGAWKEAKRRRRLKRKAWWREHWKWAWGIILPVMAMGVVAILSELL